MFRPMLSSTLNCVTGFYLKGARADTTLPLRFYARYADKQKTAG
jgi:hypothetical protein